MVDPLALTSLDAGETVTRYAALVLTITVPGIVLFGRGELVPVTVKFVVPAD